MDTERTPGPEREPGELEDPDFARGQERRPEGVEEEEGPDFARGQRRLPEEDLEEEEGSDFARGQRDLPEEG